MKLALEPTRLLGACQQCNRTTMDYATRGSQVSNICSDKKNKQFFGGKGTKFLVFFQELLQEEMAFPKCVKWGLADKPKIIDPIPTYKLKHIKIVFEKDFNELQRNLRGNLLSPSLTIGKVFFFQLANF